MFSCCGFESSQEWLETTNSTINVDSNLPESCETHVNIACKDMLNDWIDNKKVILICIGIGVLTFEFILIGLSIFLIKVINRDHRNIKEMALKKRFGLLDEYGIARAAPGRPSFVPNGQNGPNAGVGPNRPSFAPHGLNFSPNRPNLISPIPRANLSQSVPVGNMNLPGLKRK